MTKTNLRQIMACIDYAIQQDESSNGEVFVLSLKEQAAELKNLRAAVEEEYRGHSWVKDFVDRNLQMLIDLQSYAEIKDEEYIYNILELKANGGLTDSSMFYVLSRLTLAKQNCSDDLVDCHTWLDMLIVEFSSNMAAVLDVPAVNNQLPQLLKDAE